mmetsp:Transcript_133654/g.316788  ORF Transcript_133654/g.316788 Transcript_133654/m.316788 type:complete len:250 (+) Transcript_133654:376-1125(+)
MVHVLDLPGAQPVVSLRELWDVVVNIVEGNEGRTPPHHGQHHSVEEEGSPGLQAGAIAHELAVSGLLLLHGMSIVCVLVLEVGEGSGPQRCLVLFLLHVVVFVLILVARQVRWVRHQRPLGHRGGFMPRILGAHGPHTTCQGCRWQLVLAVPSGCCAAYIAARSTPHSLPPMAGVHSPAIGVHVENRTEGTRQDRAGLVLLAVEHVEVVEEPTSLQKEADRDEVLDAARITPVLRRHEGHNSAEHRREE